MAEISNRAVATAAGGALLAVALAFVGKADAQQYDRAVRCDGKTVRSVELVTRSSDGAVFRKVKPRRDGVRVPFTYACLVRGGSIRRLDRLTRAQDDTAESAQIAGRFVGFRRRYPVSESDVASDIVVVDLKTGGVRSGHTALPGRPQEGDVLTLVVKRNGSVAWTAVGVRGNELTVWKVDRSTTGAQELDRGPAIDYRSLRLSADRRSVHWRNAGAERSAPLT
jgi:hypothetical protein